MATLLLSSKERRALELEDYRGSLDSLQLFRWAARSAASRRGFRANFRITDARVAQAARVLAPFLDSPLADPALAVLKGMSRYASNKDWEAKLFSNAEQALKEPFYDVDLHTGPEGCRPSAARRPFKTEEKLRLLEALRSLCDEYIGPGWAAQALAEELRIYDLPKGPNA